MRCNIKEASTRSWLLWTDKKKQETKSMQKKRERDRNRLKNEIATIISSSNDLLLLLMRTYLVFVVSLQNIFHLTFVQNFTFIWISVLPSPQSRCTKNYNHLFRMNNKNTFQYIFAFARFMRICFFTFRYETFWSIKIEANFSIPSSDLRQARKILNKRIECL